MAKVQVCTCTLYCTLGRRYIGFREGADGTGDAILNKEGEGRFTLKENMLNIWYLEKVHFVNETVRAKLQAEVLIETHRAENMDYT